MWFIGAALAVLGSVCSNLGVNTQKYSFMKNAKLGAKAKTSYCKQPLWVFGLFLVIAGSLGDFAALAFAAQSIVAPIGSVTLVANLFFAHFWLHEKLSRRDLFGTFLIIGGSTMAVAFGDHSSKTYTIHELKELYKGTLFLTYGSVIVVLGSICYVVAKKLEPKKKMLVAAIYRYDEAFNKGDEAEIIAQDSIIADLEAAYQPYEKVHPFSYCALSGMLGANSILFGKMVAELIALTFAGDNQMINPLTYVFLFCMFVTIFAQLHFLALALQHFDALYVVPVFQCFFITVSTVGGACFFLEFSEFQVIQMCMFPIGITVTLTGVYLLSARKMDQGIKRMNEEETRAHCEKKQAEREQNERSDSTDDSEGSRENNGGLTPCTQAIKRQVNGQDDIPEMHITVDVAHRQQSMMDVTEHQRVSSSDSQGNPIEMNPLHSRGKYQVPPLGLHSAKNSTYLSASPHQHARTVSQRLHGAMVPNAVGHGVLMVVGADHVDEVTPNVKDEITMNDGTVVVVTSRYARKSLNRAPNSTSPDETPRSSIIRTYGGASQHGSPVQSKHTSPIGSPHTTPKSRARSILAVYQSAYNTAVIGSTPLHQADRRLPPPLPTAFLQSHGLHVANPNHARSTSTLISPQIAAALSQHHSPAHTINIASTGGRTTPRASMIHVANVASVVAARTSLSKPRFSLTKATSILPNVDNKQSYQPVPGDDTPRHTVDVMPSMAEGTETPKIRTHTVTHSDDSNSGNGGAYVHLPSPSQSACPSPSAMASTDPTLAPPSYSKAFSLSMTPSSTQPLIMRTSSEDDPFYTQASVNEFATQPSLSLQLSLPDPPSQIGVSPGLSSLLKDDRSSSDADAMTPISPTIQQALNSSPPHPHPRHHHKRTRSSLIPTQPIDPDDPVEIEVDTHTRRISLEPMEKEALARAEALRQTTTHVNTTINSRSRPTSMTHITLDTTQPTTTTTTVPRQPTLTSKRVAGGILSSVHPSRVRLNLHGSHAELVPAPATTTALAVAIATATSQPTHPRRRSAYAQQKDAAMMVIPSTVITHGRRASMDRTTVVPLHSPPSSSPSSAHVPVRRISPRMEQLSAPFRARPMDINTVVRDTPTPLVSPSAVSVNMASSLIDTPTSSSRDPSPRQPVGVTTNKSKPPPTSKNAW